MYEGGQSLGVRVNGTDIRVSSAAEPGRSRIGLGHNARVQVADFTRDTGVLLRSGLSFSQVGAGALMLAYVAAGRIDAYFERHMLPWDAAAGLALIYEAGGVAHPYGRAEALENGGLVLASAPALHGLLCHSLGLNGGLDAGAKFGYD
jgi:myo-inositol-1(or 4)-monophosphatase